jgi:hypothetical protein
LLSPPTVGWVRPFAGVVGSGIRHDGLHVCVVMTI